MVNNITKQNYIFEKNDPVVFRFRFFIVSKITTDGIIMTVLQSNKTRET